MARESAATLRDALIERWFDPENDDPAEITDEQILDRIEMLVGEGWHAAGMEGDRLRRYENEAPAWLREKINSGR